MCWYLSLHWSFPPTKLGMVAFGGAKYGDICVLFNPEGPGVLRMSCESAHGERLPSPREAVCSFPAPSKECLSQAELLGITPLLFLFLLPRGQGKVTAKTPAREHRSS